MQYQCKSCRSILLSNKPLYKCPVCDGEVDIYEPYNKCDLMIKLLHNPEVNKSDMAHYLYFKEYAQANIN